MATTAKQSKSTRRRGVKAEPPRTPRTRKPPNMTVEEWQVALRREFGRDQEFSYKNLGEAPFFSDFAVTNPKTGRQYRVAIRGAGLGINFCSCPDFAVNTLGTCKHIEWLLAKLSRKRGAKKAFREGFHPSYSAVYLEYGAQRRLRFRSGTACPPELRRLAAKYFDDNGILSEGAYAGFHHFVRQARASAHDVRIYDDALEFVARLRDDDARRERIAHSFEGKQGQKALEKLVKTRLYPYQKHGALFAARAGRCLIADDMGLGKTVQAITATEILSKTAGVERTLVVCPTALKHQWLQEIQRFTSRDALVVEGLSPTRRDLYGKESFYKITNYETVHRDIELINGWRPDLVILDEAQRIKNWDTRRAKSIKRMDTNYAIVLTGTPLENRLAELHSIMEFVDRFHLGPLFRFLHDHQHVDETGRVVGYRDLHGIKESLAPVLVRRRKKEVLRELPSRTDKHLFLDMTDSQRKIHKENEDIVTQIVAKWRRWGFLSEADQRRLMVALQYMRMACNSTFLVDKQTDDGPKMDECRLLLEDLLAEPENKVVIFSQWLGTHELLIRRLNGLSRAHAFYHGSLDSKSRRDVINRFKQDPECRILMCTDSGGVGLNLQVASVMINMDQPWNPAVLEQRIGRIHRLGQAKPVQVYHFVSRASIEQSMLGVLKFKTSMFEGVLDGGENEVFLGGNKMKKFMETVEKVATGIADQPVLEEPVAEDETAPEESGEAAAQEMSAAVAGKQAATAADAQPWQTLLAAGMDLIAKLTQPTQPQDSGPHAAPRQSLLTQNEKTGAPEVRIPLPDPETAQQLGNFLVGLGDLLKNFQQDPKRNA
jgi:superfamily II DNA or RNA helicase